MRITSARVVRLLFLIVASCLLAGCDGLTGILNPKGVVAFVERKLLFDSTALMLIVVIPVIIMSLDFVYHYRQSNHEHKITGRDVEYAPNWCHSCFLESLWWGIPCLIILVIALITWNATHKLDPYRQIHYPGPITKVQVVALPWKWLFIYPDYNIATVNHLVLPQKEQVAFTLTSDNVPMSAFFIPQLGSQIYTMAGMQTQLHLIATEKGQLKGLNSQYNGNGFADMNFKVEVKDARQFHAWARAARKGGPALDAANYSQLRLPKAAAAEQHYASVKADLFQEIIHSYSSAEHPTWTKR